MFEVFFIPQLTKLLCTLMPHSMHPTNKLSNFLRLRVTCRSAVRPVSSQLGFRIVLLLRHVDEKVRQTAQRLKDSGILFQLLLCGGNPRRNRFFVMDPFTGIPLGMTPTYWQERQRQKLITGWTREGKLQL
jgi:hypothetical protein